MESSTTIAELPPHARPSNTKGIKNKSAAPIQITAEQLLREAWDRKEPSPSLSATPKLRIADVEELNEYQRTERQQFEMRIVRNRSHIPLWIRYARWEETQRDFMRVRSVYERAIDNEYRNVSVWIQYSEFEMRHRFVNHARNILDRAVALLPRCDALWLRYVHMEEMLRRYDLVRNIYSRWLKWLPDKNVYFSFVRFELRVVDDGDNNQKIGRAKNVYEMLVSAYPLCEMYVKYAKFEERNEEYGRARKIYEITCEKLQPKQLTVEFYISFAKFEQRRGQIERARSIYKFAIDQLKDDDDIGVIDKSYTEFEKQFGDRSALDDILLNKRRKQFEHILNLNKNDYDTWFKLITLEENEYSQSSTNDKQHKRIMQVYENAISNKPEIQTKLAWSRYIYIWLSYAAWIELHQSDMEKVIEVYKRCVSTVPHSKFSFGKLWIQYAHAEVRRGDLGGARRVFGAALGVLPGKGRVYEEYAQMECAVGEVDRAREVFTVWLTRHPGQIKAFVLLSQLEQRLGEVDRAVTVLELAINVYRLSGQSGMDMDGGGGEGEGCGVGDVWSRLVRLVAASYDKDEAIGRFEGYVDEFTTRLQNDSNDNDDNDEGWDERQQQVWTAYVELMMELEEEDKNVRSVFERAYTATERRARLTTSEQSSVRLLDMTEAWLAWEQSRPEAEEKDYYIQIVQKHMPKRVVIDGKTIITLPERSDNNNTQQQTATSRLLAVARKWKQLKN